MNDFVDIWLENPYVSTLAFYTVAILAMVVFMTLFELVTKYSNWQEIRKGNVAVAMATGGKLFGIGNVFRFSIAANDSVYESLIWATYGFVLLLAAYFIFEFATPWFNVDKEIARDNRAVGFISMVLSVALSYVIGASVA